MCMLYGSLDTEAMQDIAVVYQTEVKIFGYMHHRATFLGMNEAQYSVPPDTSQP